MRCTSCNHDNLPGADQCEKCHVSLTQKDVPSARIESAIEQSLNEDKVRALNPVEAFSAPEDTSLHEAIRIMRERKIGYLLVTDREYPGQPRVVPLSTATDPFGSACSISQPMRAGPRVHRIRRTRDDPHAAAKLWDVMSPIHHCCQRRRHVI